jgi:hypothetical protein
LPAFRLHAPSFDVAHAAVLMREQRRAAGKGRDFNALGVAHSSAIR